jgi:NifU-like protein involved in Fe-S cluster formation
MLIQIALIGLVLMLLGAGCYGWLRLAAGRRPPAAERRVRVEGACGDTVELGLTVRDDRVVHCRVRTTGCAHSLVCMQAAARLARGRRPADIHRIDAERISLAIGGLPDDHRDCATLAARALHAAADEYLQSRKKTDGTPSAA